MKLIIKTLIVLMLISTAKPASADVYLNKDLFEKFIKSSTEYKEKLSSALKYKNNQRMEDLIIEQISGYYVDSTKLAYGFHERYLVIQRYSWGDKSEGQVSSFSFCLKIDQSDERVDPKLSIDEPRSCPL